MARAGEKGGEPSDRRLAQAARAARARAGRAEARPSARRAGGAMDVFGGEVRRRDVFPLLVLHLIAREPAYGNRLIEEIGAITGGAISVNPNTIYPLLRDLESRGSIEGQWEHPDRRTRRFYSITPDGRREYRRLVAELEPFLDSVIQSVTLIKREIYGESGGPGRRR
ncbi:MAG TPA: PadR family transcriptional regulator [Solirubrobacterales bacterium]|nr:PadR family transcriptional regulator [Solirubrobacterales bacterium]